MFIPTALRDAKPAPVTEELVEEPPPRQTVFIPTAFRDAKHEPVTEELVDAKRQRREEGGSSTDAAAASKDKGAAEKVRMKATAATAAATGRMRGSAATATAGRRDQRVAAAKLFERHEATKLLADDPIWAIADAAAAAAARTIKDEEDEEELKDGAEEVAASLMLSPEVAASMVKTKVEHEKHEGWGAVVTVTAKTECKDEDDTTAAASIAELGGTTATAARLEAAGLADAEDAGGAAAMLEASGLTDAEDAGGAAADGTGDTLMNDDKLVDALVDDALVDAYDAAEDAAVAHVLRQTRVMDVLVDPYL